MGFNASALSANTIKTFVDRLNKRNKEKTTWPPKRSAVQEDIAKVLGYDSWHALNKAIDTPKSATPTLPQHFVGAENWTVPKEYDKTEIIWSMIDWNKHCLVWGNDETRSEFFTRFAQSNPSRPMLVIQGQLALPMNNWNETFAQSVWNLGALMIGALDFTSATAKDIVDVFKIWNDSSYGLYSLDILSMVCEALIELRDAHKVDLSVDSIMEHLKYDCFVVLAQRHDLSQKTTDQMRTYLQKTQEYPHLVETHNSNVNNWNTVKYIVDRFNTSQDNNHRVLLSHLEKHHNKDLQKQIETYLDWWVAQHKDGLIVVDGLHSTSDLYEFLLRRLAVYKRDGVGVVFGCANAGDFPNTQIFAQIEGRMGRCFSL